MYDSIIFDLDGTLWDSTPESAASWTITARNFGLKDITITAEQLQRYFGRTLWEIGENLFPELERSDMERLIRQCCIDHLPYLSEHHGTLFSGVKDTLTKLSKNYKLSIVSNCLEGYIEVFLESMNLKHFFIDFEDQGRTGLTKAENIRLIIERNNLKNPVYVGDTKGDADSSKKSGIPFVYAAYGFGTPDYYDYKINSFTELEKIFL